MSDKCLKQRRIKILYNVQKVKRSISLRDHVIKQYILTVQRSIIVFSTPYTCYKYLNWLNPSQCHVVQAV